MNILSAALLIFALQVGSPITHEDGIHAVMGEARGEGYIGKLAVAEALRRRGHTRGVYGLRVPYKAMRAEKAQAWADARTAWEVSKKTNVTHGATHWFSDKDLRKLARRPRRWFRRLTKTVKIGGHTFYKELK